MISNSLSYFCHCSDVVILICWEVGRPRTDCSSDPPYLLRRNLQSILDPNVTHSPIMLLSASFFQSDELSSPLQRTCAPKRTRGPSMCSPNHFSLRCAALAHLVVHVAQESIRFFRRVHHPKPRPLGTIIAAVPSVTRPRPLLVIPFVSERRGRLVPFIDDLGTLQSSTPPLDETQRNAQPTPRRSTYISESITALRTRIYPTRGTAVTGLTFRAQFGLLYASAASFGRCVPVITTRPWYPVLTEQNVLGVVRQEGLSLKFNVPRSGPVTVARAGAQTANDNLDDEMARKHDQRNNASSIST